MADDDEVQNFTEITPEDSVVPIYLVPLTAEEEAEREQWAQEQLDREKAEQEKTDAKTSGIAKLMGLGLTEEEAKAVIGL